MLKTFYRVANKDTKQGLWYDYEGKFTGLIHTEFIFCANTNLPMDFDLEVVGYVSVCEMFQDLLRWFTPKDIIRLQESGWYVYEYQCEDYKWYPKFDHYLAKQSSLINEQRYVLTADNSVIGFSITKGS